MAIRAATPGRGYQQTPALTFEQWLREQQSQAGNPYASVSAQQAQRASQGGAPSYMDIASSVGEGPVMDFLNGGSAAPAATEVGSAANGGIMMSDGTIAGGSGPFSLSGIGGAGNYILPAAGAIGMYDVLKNDRGPVRGTLQGAASGAAIGSAFPVVGTAIGAGVGGAIGLGKSLLTKKHVTRDLAKKNTQDLQSQFGNDATYQAYVRGMREQSNSAPPDPSKPFAGKYSTWEDYKKAGLEAGDLTGVYGNINTFGQDWTNIDQGKREAVTQALIDNNLYDSRKGEVNITDANKARQIYQQVMGGGYTPPKSTAAGGSSAGRGPNEGLVTRPAMITPGAGASATAAPMMIPRSSTRSPGIGLDGKRLKAVGGRL